MHTLKRLFFSIIITAIFVNSTNILATSTSSRMINAVEQHNLPELKRIIKNYEDLGVLALFIPITMMKQETVTIPKKEYKELLEEVGILHNSEMMDAIRENDEAKKRGVKTWKINVHK